MCMIPVPYHLQQIFEAIDRDGGRPYLVGGCVRDYLLGLVPKDWDFEVFGLASERLQEVLGRFGKVSLVGESFGVLKLRAVGEYNGPLIKGFRMEVASYDFNLPRRESKTGQGHKQFHVTTDPFMTPAEAASR